MSKTLQLPSTPAYPKHEQRRYELPDQTVRVIYGQRCANGHVRLTDEPLQPGPGRRAYLIQSHVDVFEEPDGTESVVPDAYAHLQAIVADYVQEAGRLGRIPVAHDALLTDTPSLIVLPPEARRPSPFTQIVATRASTHSEALAILKAERAAAKARKQAAAA